MLNKKTTILLETGINPVNETDQVKVKPNQDLDTQVKAAKQKRYRRKFNTAEKLKILEAYDACRNAYDRGALLRKEGLYYTSITRWRSQLNEKNSKPVHSKAYKLTLEHNQVMRENAALKKKLAQAEAIIELQKKVSELLSAHVLSPETNEVKS